MTRIPSQYLAPAYSDLSTGADATQDPLGSLVPHADPAPDDSRVVVRVTDVGVTYSSAGRLLAGRHLTDRIRPRMLFAVVYAWLRLILDLADVRLRLHNPEGTASPPAPTSRRQPSGQEATAKPGGSDDHGR